MIYKTVLMILPAIWAAHTEPKPASQNSLQVELFAAEALQANGRFTLTPGFSPDGQTMYFSQTECLPIWECPQRLKRSRRISGGWSSPELVPLPVNSRVDYPSVTPDGERLLVSWMVTHPGNETADSQGNFDLWSLDLKDPSATPEPLIGPDLNRVRDGRVRTLRFVNNETQPSLTEDGDLYFWSERVDGRGDRDVYVARSDGNEGFQEPEPLPSPINSSTADDGAWVSPGGDLMLITYSDRGGCGGSDLFISYLQEGRWSEPENLGCEINSPYTELAATMIPGSRQIVFPSNRPVAGMSEGTIQLWTASLPRPD